MKRSIMMLSILLSFVITVFGAERSRDWSRVRAAFIRSHPTCAVCGISSDLQVHHIRPFHLDPSLELDPNNLITLCTSKNWGFNCHAIVGHGRNFRYENPWVVQDAKYLNELGNSPGCFTNQECVDLIEWYLKEVERKVKAFNRKNK